MAKDNCNSNPSNVFDKNAAFHALMHVFSLISNIINVTPFILFCNIT